MLIYNSLSLIYINIKHTYVNYLHLRLDPCMRKVQHEQNKTYYYKVLILCYNFINRSRGWLRWLLWMAVWIFMIVYGTYQCVKVALEYADYPKTVTVDVSIRAQYKWTNNITFFKQLQLIKHN